jgi:hypothetical protein
MRRYPVQRGPASITTAAWAQLRLQILELILICLSRWLLDRVLGFAVNLAERKRVTVCITLASRTMEIALLEGRV